MNYELNGAEGTLTIVRIDNREDVYLWHYKGREWRVTFIHSYIGIHPTARLHFDYLKDIG